MVTEYGQGGAPATADALVDAAWAAARRGDAAARRLVDSAWAALSNVAPETGAERERWEETVQILGALERELARRKAADDAALGRLLAGVEREEGRLVDGGGDVDRLLARLEEELGPVGE